MTRSTAFTVSLLFLAVPHAVAPVRAEAQVLPPCRALVMWQDLDIQLPDDGMAYRFADPPSVDRVAAQELARIAVPVLDGVTADPLPRDRDFTLSETERERLAERTVTIRQMRVEEDARHRLVPR